MSETEKKMNVAQEIITGTKEVFSTMLMLDITGEDISAVGRSVIQPNLSSMIGLGGGVRGMLAVHCPADVAKFITGSFLGMEVEELDEDVKDAVGEIANMVAGNLKVSFADQGVNIELAIPTSTIGDSFKIAGIAGSNRHVVSFPLDSGTFWIELLYVLN